MSSPQTAQSLPRHWRALLWSVLIAMGLYVGFAMLGDVEAVGASMRRLGLSGWVIVLGLSLVNYGLRFVRWALYIDRLGARLPVVRHAAYYVAGFALTTTPGKAGEAIRSVYLRRHGVPVANSLGAFFAERLVDVMAMLLLAATAMATFPSYRWLVIVVAVLVVVVIGVLQATRLRESLHARWMNRAPGRLTAAGTSLFRLARSASALTAGVMLTSGLALALVAWGAEGIAFGLILHALDIEIALSLAVGVYSVSVLAGALSFIPGGLGSTEAVMVLLLTALGVDTSTAIAATLICRLATLWFAVVIGGIVLAMLELRKQDNALVPVQAEAMSDG